MMTSKLKGVEAYYSTLEVLNAPTTIRGRVTTQLEMALPGTFEAKGSPTGKESFKKMQAAPATKWCWIPRTFCSARRRGSGKALSHRHLGKRPGSLPRLFERAGHFVDRR